MSVEAITEALHEHMYEKLNDSPKTEEEKKIRYLNKRKAKSHKEQTDKPTKFKEMDCNRCGAPNWSRQHACPARGKKRAICEKIGHYAKCCRTNKKVNRIQQHETSSAEEDAFHRTQSIASIKRSIQLVKWIKTVQTSLLSSHWSTTDQSNS